MKKFFFIHLFVIFSYSCVKERKDDNIIRQIDNSGAVIAAPYIWKTSLHLKEPVSNGNLKFPVMYHDNVLVPISNGEEGNYLALLNTIDGQVIWKWRDIFLENEYAEVTYYHQYKNLLTYQNGSRSYCINMDNGETHWKIRRDRSFNIQLTSSGKDFFMFGPDTIDIYGDRFINFTNIAYKIDIENGDIVEKLAANFTYEQPYCARGVDFVNPVPQREHLLLVSYFENLPDWIMQSYFGLYDTNLAEWVWDKVLITPPKINNIVDYPPQILNDRIYAVVDNHIVCHDLTTGIQIWKRGFTNNFLFSGFIIEDGRLIANNEDCFAVCLELITGQELWRVNTAGTSGRMSYLNGIVYFAGGSDDKLFAIEATTGKIVWRINPKMIEEDNWAQFKYNAVYTLPAKEDQPAKVIALTEMYAYCFEAYR